MKKPTRTKILQASLQQLNQWTAEYVMGWTYFGWDGNLWQDKKGLSELWWFCGEAANPQPPMRYQFWMPAHEWNTAMMLRDKVAKWTPEQQEQFLAHMQDCASFLNLKPEHICRAALLVV